MQTIDPMQVAAPLLTFNEHQLCSSLNLPPTRYITIKTVLLSNSKINDMDPVEKRIKKHLIQAGWLKKSKE
jgi:transcriptional adapter 2-beta